MLLDHVSCPRQEEVGHAVMTADGSAVIQSMMRSLLNARKMRLPFPMQTQFTWDGLFSEIALADEERHDKETAGRHVAHRRGDAGFLLPKCFDDLAENFSAPQLACVLINGRAGIGVAR